MITCEEYVEIHALKKRGWTISAIARHLDRDRKTVRAWLSGERMPGKRRRSGVDRFAPYEPYVRQRLTEDPHLRGTALYDEIKDLGYPQSYQTLARRVRLGGLRPPCSACSGVRGQPTAQIEHPPGEEIQWDWLELPETPWGEKACVLVGALSHSGRFRARICERMDQVHLIDGLHRVLEGLGGTARRWRVDRMATVIVPGTSRIQPSFAGVARHYGVAIDPCPARRPNRKGVVEKAIDYLTGRWWRTARADTPAAAQKSLERFCVNVADRRPRGDRTVGELAEEENLLELPKVPYPAEGSAEREADRQGLVAFAGNRYSLPPSAIGSTVLVRWRLGSDRIHVQSAGGRLLAVHRAMEPGQGRIVRLPEHAGALQNLVLANFATARPCRRKENRPPSEAALAIAAGIGGSADAPSPVIDLGVYQRYIDNQKGI